MSTLEHEQQLYEAINRLLDGQQPNGDTGRDFGDDGYNGLYQAILHGYSLSGIEGARRALGTILREPKYHDFLKFDDWAEIAEQMPPPSKNGKPRTEHTEYTGGRWIPNAVTAYQLQRTEFEELNWIVDDLIPAGFTLLAAKPKAKKSWLALGLAVAVASENGQAFGKLDCLHGDALYLDLESNQRRMKHRLESMMLTGNWPERLHVVDATSWHYRGDFAINELEYWMVSHPETRLIVIDVFQNIRPPRTRGGDQYEGDTELTQAISQFAGRNNVAVLAIHHTRKQKSPDDIFEEISGSTGIAGGVDNMLMLSKRVIEGREQVTLEVRGRDVIDDTPRAMSWDSMTCQWIVEGDAVIEYATNKDREVLDLLSNHETLHYKQIAIALSTNEHTMRRRLNIMVDKRILFRPSAGNYSLPN